MTMADSSKHLVPCLDFICNPQLATNAVAWFDLEQAGLTREALKTASEKAEWKGPKPLFDKAPDRDSPIWKFLLEGKPK